MRIAVKWTVVVAIVMLCLPASAQVGMRQPQMRGMWHPVVGAGAVYEMQSRDAKKNALEVAVVGQEQFQGKPGYWLEMSFPDPRGGEGISKMLMVTEGENPGPKRMIVKMGGEAMEMPMNSPMMANRSQSQNTDIRKDAVRLGTETITTPAGTFVCEHWRTNDQSSDVWLSDKVSPWGIVKTTGKDSSLLLTRLVTDAKTKITGPVKQFDVQEMMKQQRP
jgi:hypothetical protein